MNKRTADQGTAGGKGEAAFSFGTQYNRQPHAVQAALQRVLDALERHGCRPRRSGNRWTAFCPVHERDGRRHSPSLSITTGDNGRVLLHCHSNRGCSTDAIVKALGLRLRDLFSDAHTTNHKATTPNATKSYRTPLEAMRSYKLGEPSAKHPYRDAGGKLLGVVYRWDGPHGKEIRPVAVGEDGRWYPRQMKAPRPLYRLPELLKADPSTPIAICEGEKACDAATQLGFTSTTSAGGAKAAKQSDWSPLAGRTVWIVPDFDEPGEAYAQDVARLCHQTGAREVKILDWSNILPGRELPQGYDLADAVAECDADPKALAELCARIDHAAEQTDPWKPDLTKEPGPVMICLADVQPEPIRWLWPGRIPLGRITLLAGVPGIGKSFLALDMASRVSTGTPWPDGEVCPMGSVLILSAEDDPADTIRPRLDAMRADVRQMHLLPRVRRIEAGKPYEVAITLHDVDAIEQAIANLPDCRLVIVDPIGSYLGSRTDGNAENQVRAVLQPLAHLARQHGPAVVIVAHRRKATGTTADEVVMGSRAFTGLARAVWHICRDPHDNSKARRLMLPGKMNLAGDVDGLAFAIGDEPPRVFWDREPVEMTADDALAAEAEGLKRGPEARRRAEAERLLREALANGPRPGKDVEAELMKAGIAKKTIRNARESLGIKAYQPMIPGPWLWRLPDD